MGVAGMANTVTSSTMVCYTKHHIHRNPLHRDASRRAGGELQIDRAAATRVKDTGRGRAFSTTFVGIHR